MYQDISIRSMQRDTSRVACKKCGYAGHLTFQCRNFIKVDPNKDIVLDVSSTSSESEDDKLTPLTSLQMEELKEKLKKKRSKSKSKKSKKRRKSESTDSDSSSSDKSRKKKRKKSKKKKRKREKVSNSSDSWAISQSYGLGFCELKLKWSILFRFPYDFIAECKPEHVLYTLVFILIPFALKWINNCKPPTCWIGWWQTIFWIINWTIHYNCSICKTNSVLPPELFKFESY